MYKIVEKKALAPNVKLMGIEAEHVVRNARAGNFIIIVPDAKGERIPLTIYDLDKKKNIVYTIFQELGTTTFKLGRLNVGESVFAVAGPLGKAFTIEKYGRVVMVGGGIGIPAIYPIAKALQQAGNTIISVVGARNKGLLILENEMKNVSSELLVATDDGSYGKKGLVTHILQELIDKKEQIDLVVAVGPVVMMKAVSEVTRPYKIKTIVSLNAMMIDGTGMCGGCRVTVGKDTKFSCVDGPEFDGHLVDFAELTSRLGSFKNEEKESLHKCKLELNLE
jgi:ferredoxin--NADP+ reductase